MLGIPFYSFLIFIPDSHQILRTLHRDHFHAFIHLPTHSAILKTFYVPSSRGCIGWQNEVWPLISQTLHTSGDRWQTKIKYILCYVWKKIRWRIRNRMGGIVYNIVRGGLSDELTFVQYYEWWGKLDKLIFWWQHQSRESRLCKNLSVISTFKE